MKKSFIALGLLVLIVGVGYGWWWFRFAYVPAEYAAPASQYAHALELEKQGHIDEAIRWYRRAAYAGVPEAMLRLGMAYTGGKSDSGLPISPRNAAKYFLAAAEAGNAEGMAMIAMFYESGAGIPRNDKLALTWYEHAAEKGQTVAIERLIEVYKNGELGEVKSAERQAEWTKRLAQAKQNQP